MLDSLGQEAFTKEVEHEYGKINLQSLAVEDVELARLRGMFAVPYLKPDPSAQDRLNQDSVDVPGFQRWSQNNTADHKVPGYAIAIVSLKPIGGVPGDATAEQMDVVADLADRFSLGEIRITYTQNLILPHVRVADLKALWQELDRFGLSAPNAGLITDIIACPGMDYCSLANTRSIPIAQRISETFSDLKEQHSIGPLDVRISGCINACGHHHAGHIGILGVDKKGKERYQLTLGGQGDGESAVGKIVGPGFNEDDIVAAVKTVIATYLYIRKPEETFSQTLHRTGLSPFKEKLYGNR